LVEFNDTPVITQINFGIIQVVLYLVSTENPLSQCYCPQYSSHRSVYEHWANSNAALIRFARAPLGR